MDRKSMSTPLTFKELAVNDRFIGFPVDGDDVGHGGYPSGAYLLIKTQPAPTKYGLDDNYRRVLDGVPGNLPDSFKVYKVLL